MRRWDNIRRVSRREFWTTVTRPGFIISTLLLPLLPAFLVGFQALIDPERIIGGNEPSTVGIVDETRFLDLTALSGDTDDPPEQPALPLPPGVNLPGGAGALQGMLGREARAPDTYLAYADEDLARKALLDGELTGYVVLGDDWLETGQVAAYRVRRPEARPAGSPFGTRLGLVIRRGLLARHVDDPRITERVLGLVADRDEHLLAPDGSEIHEEVMAEDVRRFLVPLMAALFLSVALFAGAGYLLLGLSEEKENRILELLLASLTPDELLAGKLIGIGAAGLVQFSVWVSIVAVPTVLALPDIGMGPSQLLWATGFFLGGYALFGALMLGVGAIADTARHAQQLSGIFTLVAMIPFLFNFLIIQEPQGLFARVFTFIPLTSPITVMLRMAAEPTATWELALALAILLGAGWLALIGAARLFRVSLLMHGRRPSLREIFRWLKTG